MPLTCSRLSSSKDIVRASQNSPSLKQGAQGEGVRVLQLALIDLGFPMPVSTHQGETLPDGIFGSETARVLKAFQLINALVSDGIAGAKTIDRLDKLLAARSDVAIVTDRFGNRCTGRN